MCCTELGANSDDDNRVRKGEYRWAEPPIADGSIAPRRLWEGL